MRIACAWRSRRRHPKPPRLAGALPRALTRLGSRTHAPQLFALVPLGGAGLGRQLMTVDEYQAGASA